MNPLSTTPAAPDSAIAEFNAVLHGGAYTVLDQFGVIDASGDDAAPFLHNQLTNDVENLDGASARLGGFCSPKGRLLATFLYWRQADAVRLLLAADLQAAVRQRLAMFVMRSKAKLVDVGAEVAMVGFAGDVRAVLARVFDALPDGVHVKVDGPAGALIRLPDAAGRARYLWSAPRAALEARRAELDAALTAVAPGVWDWLDIRAGEPRISAATQEQFVPQMVNFEVLGGVNFRKGCYPGQEVVARSQYRGTIKRRAMLAHADAAQAGAELFHDAEPAQPCGMVINAAAAPGGGVDCLVEVKLAALQGGTIHVGAPQGPALAFLALPYALPDTAIDAANA